MKITMNLRKMQSTKLQIVQISLQNYWMYATVQKGVKSLGAFMQQVRIEMKRMVRNNLLWLLELC